ncbi:ATP-binding protein [Chitinibacteraceae bacterium HSL-7]
MGKLFARFYLTLVLCFLGSGLLVGAVYKQMLERINRQYLSDVFQTTLTIVENELGALPQSLWHDEIARLRDKLPVPVSIAAIRQYDISDDLRERIIKGDTLYVSNRSVYLRRIPRTELVIELGPIQYLSRLEGFSWLDALGLSLMAAALLLPSWLWLRPFWRDLLMLIRQSRSLGRGHFGARATLGTSSPLAPLSETMNRMAADIEDLTTSRQAMIDAISHDVRTPLARLRYRLEAAKAGMPIDTILEGAERDLAQMDQLVEEWLTLRKLERPELKLDCQSFDAVPWLAQIAAEQPDAVAFENISGASYATLSADRYYLGRAVTNLLTNAARYGGGTVRMTLARTPPHLTISVDDNGPGIPVDAREQVLKPFERIEGSRNRATGGYGLGLAITLMIVERHGGTLSIDDSDLGGARMIIRLPIAGATGG